MELGLPTETQVWRPREFPSLTGRARYFPIGPTAAPPPDSDSVVEGGEYLAFGRWSPPTATLSIPRAQIANPCRFLYAESANRKTGRYRAKLVALRTGLKAQVKAGLAKCDAVSEGCVPVPVDS